jgi:hypothetical protein
MARNNDALRYPTNTATNIELYNRDLKDSNSLAGAPMRISEPISTDSVKHMSIVLQRLPNDSTKEVVLNSGRLKSVAKYPKVVIDTLEPAEGYVVFDDYVINNLKVPDEFKTKPLSGDVQLSFDVDANGQPVNITVVKSLCQTCDAEAIRLLKEGPKWKKKNNKKGKVTFRF